MPEHPISEQARNLSPDIRAMAVQQSQEWDATVQGIEALQPGDPTAEETLRHASVLLSSIVTNYGSRHGWLLAQRHLIYRHAKRLFGPDQLRFNRPGWTET